MCVCVCVCVCVCAVSGPSLLFCVGFDDWLRVGEEVGGCEQFHAWPSFEIVLREGRREAASGENSPDALSLLLGATGIWHGSFWASLFFSFSLCDLLNLLLFLLFFFSFFFFFQGRIISGSNEPGGDFELFEIQNLKNAS